MAKRLAIHHPAGRTVLGANVFGKDVANTQLYRALAAHGGFERLDVMVHGQVSRQDVARDLLGGLPNPPALGVFNILNQTIPAAAGALLRGQADFEALAWLRRTLANDRSHSLLGMVHTLAPPAVREFIAKAAIAPVQPWDAIICTSPSVQSAVRTMFEEWCDFLAGRYGGDRRPMPQLPLIPLGVDQAAFQAQADRPEVRAALRAELGLGEEDVLVLWVGRLSFFEKAFPQPMFQAIARAAALSGRRMHFALAGWFPDPARHRPMYEAAARAYAPDVPLHIVDGNDQDAIGRLWAGSDIFLSLVDNIQETFGITPIEAMSAGLPVVASDWDGYRYTMRDGIEAFLIPTLGAAPNLLGQRMIDAHVLGMSPYQHYAGGVAQHTAVHVGRCAEALAELARSPELRARMGAAGRERIRTMFDWPVVAPQINGLVDDLAEIRATAEGWSEGPSANPVKNDPFTAFAGFATHILAPDTRLSIPPGSGPNDLIRAASLDLDRYADSWRGTPEECAKVLDLVASGKATTVETVLTAFPPERHRHMQLGLVWLAKLGMLDWL